MRYALVRHISNRPLMGWSGRAPKYAFVCYCQKRTIFATQHMTQNGRNGARPSEVVLLRAGEQYCSDLARQKLEQ
jgi:hypothetical protein